MPAAQERVTRTAGKKKKPKKRQVSAVIDAEVYEAARRTAYWLKGTHGLSLTKLIEEGMRLAVERHKAQEYNLEDPVGGFQVRKPAGSPFPAPSGDLKTGRTPK